MTDVGLVKGMLTEEIVSCHLVCEELRRTAADEWDGRCPGNVASTTTVDAELLVSLQLHSEKDIKKGKPRHLQGHYP